MKGVSNKNKQNLILFNEHFCILRFKTIFIYKNKIDNY